MMPIPRPSKQVLAHATRVLKSNPTIAVIPSGDGLYAWVVEAAPATGKAK